MAKTHSTNSFINYLVSTHKGDSEHLPPLKDLSKTLDVSVATLREQLEVAKTLGFVEVRPRTGIRRRTYTFLPAVKESLFYAIEVSPNFFEDFSKLRNHIEAAYWYEAVEALTDQDHTNLQELLARALAKLNGSQIHIPHEEHRQLHMGIFSRLDNPFVLGILEAYWEAYEAVGLNLYTGYDYLQQVWEYHKRMVDAICMGDHEAGYRALVDHSDLLYHRPVPSSDGNFVGPVIKDSNESKL